MNQIYDLGYRAIGSLDLLTNTVLELDAFLVDIRLTGSSPVKHWRPRAFASRLGARYRHISDLGNLNYRIPGPIKLKDLDAGLKELLALLQTTNVVLMCTCERRSNCHRKAVIYELQTKHGLTTYPLSKQECKEIVNNALQLALIPNL